MPTGDMCNSIVHLENTNKNHIEILPFIYLNGRQRQADRDRLSIWLTSQISLIAEAWPETWNFIWVCHMNNMDTDVQAITCCFLGCSIVRSWVQEDGKDLDPGTLMWVC